MTPDRHSARIARYTQTVLRYRWLVLVGSLAITLLIASGARNLSFTSEYEVYFEDDNVLLVAFETLKAAYADSEFLQFVVHAPDGTVFTPETLAAIKELTDASWQMPYAIRVDSLTNYQHTRAEADDLIVADLVTDPENLTEAELAYIRNVAINEPLLESNVVAQDSKTTGVSATLNMPKGQAAAAATEEIMAFARPLAERIAAENSQLEIRLAGGVPLNNAFSEIAIRDNQRLLPITMAFVLVVAAICLRTAAGVLGILAIMLLSVSIGMGFGGWTGVVLVTLSATAPIMIVTIAVADGMHVLITANAYMRRGVTRDEAIVKSLQLNAGPVFLTSFTTLIGFLSLNYSDTPPYRDLGNIAAAGVAGAWFLSMTLMPALIGILPARSPTVTAPTAPGEWTDVLTGFVCRHRRALGICTIVVLLTSLSAFPLLSINDHILGYFDKATEFRQTSDFTSENLSPPLKMEFSVGADQPGSIAEPGYLEALAGFTTWLRDRPDIGHVHTFSDVMRRLNMNLHGDNPASYRLPESRELAAQYLLLYEMSLPYGLDLNNLINTDKSATRVRASIYSETSTDIKRLKSEADEWLRDNGLLDIGGSGPSVMFAFINEANSKNMLIATGVALLLICLTMMISLRSARLGIVSLIPNCLPVILAFGIWAVMSGRVTVSASVVVALVLGLIVDATVHIAAKYRNVRRRDGKLPEESIRYAFRTSLPAILASTVILGSGFIVLSFSHFLLNSTMGQLSALVIVCAIIVDIFLYPSMLLALERYYPIAKAKEKANETITG